MAIRKWFGRKNGEGEKPSLDAVRFDTTGYAAQGEPQPGKVRVWHSPEGDGLGVYFFPVPPDLPANAASVDELASFYQRLLGESGGKLVEAGVVVAGGCPAVRTILSVPQQPSGRTYVGSLTVPFRDFSFVIKCQCEEGGPTGLKEAVLMERSRASGEPMQIEGGRLQIPGWNPDDPKHDAEFPEHPVARVRRVLDHVADTLVLADHARELPGFALPANQS
jgi:hypothetical protein